jgi:hypothetical protein
MRGKNDVMGLRENFLDYRVIFGDINEKAYMMFSVLRDHTR